MTDLRRIRAALTAAPLGDGVAAVLGLIAAVATLSGAIALWTAS